MRELFGVDLARAAGGERLFAWCDGVSGEREVPKTA
jgi:hypothetical protein